jgi:DNA-binding NtrC family response regulator
MIQKNSFSETNATAAAISREIQLATPATIRILVADDDPTTSESLHLMSGRYGFEVVSASDGREAFRLLKRDANFAVAIFNMTMPNLLGTDIVRYMKTEKRLMRIPVIIVSGDQGIRTISDSFAAGAMAFLAKPFGVDQLQRALRLAIGAQMAETQPSAA